MSIISPETLDTIILILQDMYGTSFLADLSASIDAGTDFARLEICPEVCNTDPVDISNSF